MIFASVVLRITVCFPSLLLFISVLQFLICLCLDQFISVSYLVVTITYFLSYPILSFSHLSLTVFPFLSSLVLFFLLLSFSFISFPLLSTFLSPPLLPCLSSPFFFSMNHSIEATARDPLTGKRYFQPTVFAAPKHPASPVRSVYPHKTLDSDSMPVEKRVEGNGKNNSSSSSHIKGSTSLAITVPSVSSSTSTSTSASTCASVSKRFSASVSTGVSSRVRRTPEEVYRALTNTQSAHRDTQKSSQLQVELQEQNEVLM
jgi:hypothetical protein